MVGTDRPILSNMSIKHKTHTLLTTQVNFIRKEAARVQMEGMIYSLTDQTDLGDTST